MAYLHPPFDENPNHTHFILKNLLKDNVCFKVKSRQSKHIQIRVSPSSGLIYKSEDSLTIKVTVEPVKNKESLDRIASGKEKLEVGLLKLNNNKHFILFEYDFRCNFFSWHPAK